MKVKLFITALGFITINAFSQITVTDANLVNIGDVIYQSYDDTPSSSIEIGGSGINQIWDFSALEISSTDTLFFVDPVSTANAGLYSNVNLSMLQQGSVSYFNKTSSGMYLHGISDTVFNSPALFYPLPLTYGLAVSDGPILVIDNLITGALLSIALPPATVSVISNGLANRADTALIKITNTTDFLVDASGTITTPLGTFAVLRLKSVKYTNSLLDIYCSDTLSGTGAWINNVPFSSIPVLATYNNTAVEYKYEWLTNDASVEFLVAEAIVDSLDNITGGVLFQIIPSQTGVQELVSNAFKVYPVPATYSLTIKSEENMITDLILRDTHGKLILEDQFNASMILSLDGVANGIYYLTLKTENGELTKKVIVE